MRAIEDKYKYTETTLIKTSNRSENTFWSHSKI